MTRSDLRAGRDVLLEVEGLQVEFATDDGLVRAVRGVDLALAAGEVVGIVGESGSGKSVTSLAIMGLLPKTAIVRGSVRYRGEELVGAHPNRLNEIRGRNISMIFQDPMSSLNPVYTVGWQLAEAVRVHHREVGKDAAQRRAVELLDLVGIPNAAGRVDSYPHEFSGGMRQRAVIAMAIANDPEVIIADEPTTALDVTVQAQILDVLVEIKDRMSAGIVLITHDLGVVAGMTDRILVMYAGKPVEIGEVDEVFEHPRMPYTLGLLGSVPRLDAADDEALTPIAGSPPSLINLPPGCPFSSRCPLSRERCEQEEPPLYATHTQEHRAACHFWEELAGDVEPVEVFSPAAIEDPA